MTVEQPLTRKEWGYGRIADCWRPYLSLSSARWSSLRNWRRRICKVAHELLVFRSLDMEETSKRSISWRRIAIALAIVFGLSFLLTMWIGPFYEARLMDETESEVLPRPLPDAVIASDPTVRVEREGVSFGVPWDETGDSKRRLSKSGILTLANGLVICISRPPNELDAIKSLKGPAATALRFELGDQALSSNFALISAALSTRVSDAKWWHTPLYNRKITYLLRLKLWRVGFPEGSKEAPIYSFTEGRVRGFQVGDPPRERIVKLIVFDEIGREYRIELLRFHGDISQPEINALVASLQTST